MEGLYNKTSILYASILKLKPPKRPPPFHSLHSLSSPHSSPLSPTKTGERIGAKQATSLLKPSG